MDSFYTTAAQVMSEERPGYLQAATFKRLMCDLVPTRYAVAGISVQAQEDVERLLTDFLTANQNHINWLTSLCNRLVSGTVKMIINMPRVLVRIAENELDNLGFAAFVAVQIRSK